MFNYEVRGRPLLLHSTKRIPNLGTFKKGHEEKQGDRTSISELKE